MCSNENVLCEIRSFRKYCEKKNLNMKFFTYFTDYLFINSKAIYNKNTMLKLLTYNFIRSYLDYSDEDIDNMLSLCTCLLEWDNYSIDIDFDELRENLYRIRKICSQATKIKDEIEIPVIIFKNNYWLNSANKTGHEEVVTSWFKKYDELNNYVVIRSIVNKQEYIVDKTLFERLDIRDEIVHLELYLDTDTASGRIINIGLVYSSLAEQFF